MRGEIGAEAERDEGVERGGGETKRDEGERGGGDRER